MEPIRSVQWSPDGRALRIIDQRRLPAACVELDLRTVDQVRDAISTRVRGAPAIGVAAAIGLVTALLPFGNESGAALISKLETFAAVLAAARVLTHCNAGALATAGIGTALAPVYVAHRLGRRVSVFANETRPLLQGSRLTAWELGRAGIPVTILTDGMAASLMRQREIDIVLVGADRIAANGDTANKIGTYAVAVAARHHGIPFYVCAPWSTIDRATASGDAIAIEQRSADEVRFAGGSVVAPADATVRNPAFDVTPAGLITGVITDKGVYRPPYSFTYEMRSRD